MGTTSIWTSVCLSRKLCISPSLPCAFLCPPLVPFSVSPRCLEHWDTGTLGHWDAGTLGHWGTGTLGQWDNGLGAGAHLLQPCCDFFSVGILKRPLCVPERWGYLPNTFIYIGFTFTLCASQVLQGIKEGQSCHNGVSRMFQECFILALWLWNVYFMDVLMVQQKWILIYVSWITFPVSLRKHCQVEF